MLISVLVITQFEKISQHQNICVMIPIVMLLQNTAVLILLQTLFLNVGVLLVDTSVFPKYERQRKYFHQVFPVELQFIFSL